MQLRALIVLFSFAGSAWAGARSSTNYALVTDTADAGGRRAASASYTADASLGGVAGISTADAPAETAKHGYAGQLTDVAGLALSANPASVSEGATRQLAAQAVLDDDTRLAVASNAVAWSVASGPLAGISGAGLATAGVVWTDTLAYARGAWGGVSNTLGLTVINSSPDNFGSYAGDGIDDDWQALYFGLDNPLAGAGQDPDGDRQNNRFEFTAGLVPTNAASRLLFAITRATPEVALEVAPIVAGRTYSILHAAAPDAAEWGVLSPLSASDTGTVRTYTTEADAPARFYRVRVQKP